MSQTQTGETMFQHIVRRGGLGRVMLNGDIGGIAAGTITSVLHLRTPFGQNHFTDQIVYRPGNATGAADYLRYGTTVTSAGVLSIDANWSDTTLGSENAYLMDRGVNPLDIVNAMNRARRICYFPNSELLSARPAGTALADASMQIGTTHWVESDSDGGAATTIAAESTANTANVWQTMIASLKQTTGAANGYFRKRYEVTEKEQVFWHTLQKLSSGTSVDAILYDNTNSATIGTTVSHAEAAWQWMRRIEQIPTSCVSLETRHLSQGSGDVSYWNGSAVLFPSRSFVELDTTWDSHFKVPALIYGELGGSSPESGVFPAHATRWREIPRSDYAFQFTRPGASPYAVQFFNDSQRYYFQHPVMIMGRRSFADIETTDFTLALTGTTSIDIDLFVWATLKEYFQEEGGNLEGSATKLRRAQEEYEAANNQFYQEPTAEKPNVVVSMGLHP